MADTDRLILWYLVLVNLSAFLLFRYDKGQARKGGSRISEKQLLTPVFLGGGLGALLAMAIFRHKTRHLAFRVLVPFMTIVWILLTLWYFL